MNGINRFIQKTKGSISIFLILVMLPMFTCAGLMVDGSRITAARTAVSGAGDLAMSAALSEYNVDLKKIYGLFAMSEDIEELEKNVAVYFNNTINNEGILQGSDSYTRSFINSISSLFSTDEISFDNLVDLQVENDFSLTPVTSSAIANPEVLERQITEYMKFRGPVNIGAGLLTKLGCLGETSKQTKAIEKKVEYEKQLSTVQDACVAAYKSINEFVKLVGKKTKFAAGTDYIANFGKDIEKAKGDLTDMTEAVILLDNTEEISSVKNNNKYKDASYDKDKMETVFPNLDITVKDEPVYNDDDELLYYDTEVKLPQEISALADKIPENKDTLDVKFTYIDQVAAEYDTLINMYSALKKYYSECWDKYVDYEDSESDRGMIQEDRYDELCSDSKTAYEKITKIINAAKDIRTGWYEDANTHGNNARYKITVWYNEVSAICTQLTAASTALETVAKKVGEMKTAREDWGNAVSALQDNEVKSSMESDYSNSARDLNLAAVNELKGIIDGYKTHFDSLKTKIEEVKYHDEVLCKIDTNEDDYYSLFKDDINLTLDPPTMEQLANQVAWSMNSYKVPSLTDITAQDFNGLTDDQFYQYLKRTCTESSAKEDQEAKEDATSERTELLGNANKQPTATQRADMNSIDGVISNDTLKNEIKALASEATAANTDSFSQSKIEEGSNDKMADDAKANLTSITELLSGLADLATKVRDLVYVEEYFTEMFSCYTTGAKKEDGQILEDALTLSNFEMSKDTNAYFGSEVEYILYGQDTMEENLNCAKATVFGIRFALNSIYAMTSSDTRMPALTAATAIAGWTGFGVPIVQTVILLAWSLAESLIDVNDLCSGESVVLYKSKTTWVTSINGAIKKGQEAANSAINDVFAKIEEIAVKNITEAQSVVERYVQDTQSGVVESITSTIKTSLETLAMQIIGDTGMDMTEETVKYKVTAVLDALKRPADSDSISDKAINAGLDALRGHPFIVGANTYVGEEYIVMKLVELLNNAKTGAVTAVMTEVENLIASLTTPITNKIMGVVEEVGNQLTDEVSSIISEGRDQVKEKLNTAIDGYAGKIGGRLSSADGSSGSTSISVGSSLKMSYKEYMKMLILLTAIVNKDAMLQRCAELIHANIRKCDGQSDFNITKAYTMVRSGAAVSVGTTFLNVPVTSTNEAGETTYELDFSRIGSGRWKVDYVGILGY